MFLVRELYRDNEIYLRDTYQVDDNDIEQQRFIKDGFKKHSLIDSLQGCTLLKIYEDNNLIYEKILDTKLVKIVMFDDGTVFQGFKDGKLISGNTLHNYKIPTKLDIAKLEYKGYKFQIKEMIINYNA